MKETTTALAMALLLLASLPTYAGMLDSVTVSQGSVTIVEDPRFPKYARVDLEIISQASSIRHGSWRIGEVYGDYYLNKPDTSIEKVYLWGNVLELGEVDTSINLEVYRQDWLGPKPPHDNLHYFVIDTVVFPLRIDLLTAKRRETAFSDDWEITGSYPNPFSGPPKAGFFMAVPSPVRIEMYDLKFNFIDTLFDEENVYGSRFAILDQQGGKSSGIYQLIMFVNGVPIDSAKCVLVK